MELKNPLLAVSDMARSLAFYETVLGLRVILDCRANKTLEGGMTPEEAAARMDVPVDYVRERMG